MQSRIEQLEGQVDELTEEVNHLSGCLSTLRDQVERLERKAERVARASRSSDSAASGGSGGREPPDEPPNRSPSRASSYSGTQSVPSWIQQEAICDQIGGFILRALSGDHQTSSGRDLIPLASRIWIVVQDLEANRYNPVRVFRSWSGAKALVKAGNDVGDSIFVGPPSEREARRVVHAATLDWPAEQ